MAHSTASSKEHLTAHLTASLMVLLKESPTASPKGCSKEFPMASTTAHLTASLMALSKESPTAN